MSIKARKLANGKTVYDVRVRVESRDAAGRRKPITRTAPTLQEARKLEATLKVEAMNGGVRDARRTVGDLLDAWLEAGNWSPTTAYGYRRLVEREIRKPLGSIRLDRLSARDLDRLYKSMRDRGLSGRSVERVHRVMTAALNRAVRWDWIPYSVATKATLGFVGGADGRVATEDEVKALLRAAEAEVKANPKAKAPDMVFAIRLACATGMRRSELAALVWSDVDLQAAEITVSKAIVDAGGRTHGKGTKTHAVRVIPVGKTMVAMLKERRGIGPVLNASPRVLSNRLATLCEAAGIEGEFGWHAFRHHAGTELAGVADLRTVADILGHSTLRTTEKYVHAQAKRTRAAVEALDGVL